VTRTRAYVYVYYSAFSLNPWWQEIYDRFRDQANMAKKDVSRRTLYKPGESTFSVSLLRHRFLATAYQLPDSRKLLLELAAAEIRKIAQRDFLYRRLREPSEELEALIENWAVRCRFADPPVRNWWIYEVASYRLWQLCYGPPFHGEDFEEPTEWDTDPGWGVGGELHSSLASQWPEELSYSFSPWDPTLYSGKDYLKQTKQQFETFLREHMAEVEKAYQDAGFQSVPNPRESKALEWLVRYQMLGESYSSIAATPGDRVDPITVKDKISKLRAAIQLPPRRRPGRPRKQ